MSKKVSLSCGVIPLYKNPEGEFQYLIVRGKGGYWGFPKGHQEGEETPLETAKRELYEETQLDCNYFFEETFSEEYVIQRRFRPSLLKKVIYFVGIVRDPFELILQRSEINSYRWVTHQEAQNILLPARRNILEEVRKLLFK